MKSKTFRFLSLLFLAGFVLITSCDKKNDDSVDPAKIIGLWTLDNMDVDVKINGKTPTDYIAAALGITPLAAEHLVAGITSDIEDESEMPATINFKSDGTYDVVLPSKETDDGTWTLTGNKLLIDKGTMYETEMTVITLTDNLLKVQIKEVEQEDVTKDGKDEELDITAVAEYKK